MADKILFHHVEKEKKDSADQKKKKNYSCLERWLIRERRNLILYKAMSGKDI